MTATKKAREENPAPAKRTYKRKHALIDARDPQAPARLAIYPGHLETDPHARGPMDASLMGGWGAMAKAPQPNASLDMLLLASAAEHAAMQDEPPSPEATSVGNDSDFRAPSPHDDPVPTAKTAADLADAVRKELAAANNVIDQVKTAKQTRDIAEELASELFPDLVCARNDAPAREKRRLRKLQQQQAIAVQQHASPPGMPPPPHAAVNWVHPYAAAAAAHAAYAAAARAPPPPGMVWPMPWPHPQQVM